MSAFGQTVVGPAIYKPGDVIQREVVEYDPSSAFSLTTTHQDVPGSDISFTPKRADSEIRYSFSFVYANVDAQGIGHFKLLVDGVLETESETTINNETNNANSETLIDFVYLIGSWGVTAATIKIQGREYGSSQEAQLFTSTTWEGATSAKLRRAVLTIEEIATVGGSHGDYDFTQAGCLLLDTQTASASSSIDFTNAAWFDGTYARLELVGSMIVPATDGANAFVRYSTSSSFLTTSYSGVFHLTYEGGDSYDAFGTTGISIGDNTGSASGECLSFKLVIHNPASTTEYKAAIGDSHYVNSAGTQLLNSLAGRYTGSTNALDGIQYVYHSGNIASGEFKLYGYL